jgi:hypothetical protein
MISQERMDKIMQAAHKALGDPEVNAREHSFTKEEIMSDLGITEAEYHEIFGEYPITESVKEKSNE